MARATALDRAKDELAKAEATITELRIDVRNAEEFSERLREDRDHWRDTRLPDVEAEALASCVRAIESMLQGGHRTTTFTNGAADTAAAMRPTRALEYHPARFVGARPVVPVAGDTPIGRILLNLAARYDVPVGPVAPRETVEQGERVVICSAEIADQLERIVDRGG